MKRTLMSPEHEVFRATTRAFMDRVVVPNRERWATQGMVERSAWREAGVVGLLCPWMGERWGGPGGDFLHSVIVTEELARCWENGFAMPLHSDIVVPYIHDFASDALKQRLLPGCADGSIITALAMTEPGTGSDVAGIKTTARLDGDEYILDGAKTFISNAILADVVVVAAKTEDTADPHRALSLLVVEADRPGFSRGNKLHKMGMASQDTAELFFSGCRIPRSNVLGVPGGGFFMLMNKLAQERLVVAIASQALAERVLEETLAYVKERQAFGRPIGKFQNTQFVLADCAAQIEVGRHFIDTLVARHAGGENLIKECAMAKLWQTEMLGRVVDACLQLFGGYGYMLEYPITRAFMDARVQRIYAGTSEIMKLIIAKQIGL